jgi:hypothetical protein
MALAISLPQNTGVTLSYWRIISVTVDLEANLTKVTLGGFVDKATRDAGFKASKKYYFEWVNVVTSMDMTAGTIRTKCYDKIKEETPPFAPSHPFVGAPDA